MRLGIQNLALSIVTGGVVTMSLAFPCWAEGSFGGHPGYISDVNKEKHTIDTEIVLIEKPDDSQPISHEIFDERLTKEFRQQFKYRFGVTEMEQTLNSPGRFDEYSYHTGRSVSLVEYRSEQRSFGEYMGRRLIEHHADQWFRSSPKMRPVYELKDKVTNLNMEVKKGYKTHIRYSLSGGHLDFRLENPYDLDAKIRVLTDGDHEAILSLGGAVNKYWRVDSLVKHKDGIMQVVGTRRITDALSASLTGSTDSKPEGPSVQQDLVLLGFVYSN